MDQLWDEMTNGLNSIITGDLALWTAFGVSIVLLVLGWDMILAALERCNPKHRYGTEYEDYGEDKDGF